MLSRTAASSSFDSAESRWLRSRACCARRWLRSSSVMGSRFLRGWPIIGPVMGPVIGSVIAAQGLDVLDRLLGQAGVGIDRLGLAGGDLAVALVEEGGALEALLQ